MKKMLILLAAGISLMLLIAGCSTGGSVTKLGEVPDGYTTLGHNGVTLQIAYIDYRDLVKLYGQKNNPFIRYKSGSFLVLETTIESDTPVVLNLDTARLATPGGNRGPTPVEEVRGYWDTRLSKNYAGKSQGKTQFSNWSMKITMQIIDETILEKSVTVPADEELGGYILFDQIRGEKDVNAIFTLPVYDKQGELVHEFEFSFSM
jgi:hypothetical protein